MQYHMVGVQQQCSHNGESMLIYKGHAIVACHQQGGYAVQPYGLVFPTMWEAKRWVSSHVRRERSMSAARPGEHLHRGPKMPPGRAFAGPGAYGFWPFDTTGLWTKATAMVGVGTSQINTSDIPDAYKRAPATDVAAREQASWYLAAASRVADYYGNQPLSEDLFRRARSYATAGAAMSLGSLLFPSKGEREQILRDASEQVMRLMVIPRAVPSAVVMQTQLLANATPAAQEAAVKRRKLVLVAAAAAGVALLALGGGGTLFAVARRRRNGRKAKKLTMGERFVRIGGGMMLAVIGAAGYTGPQAAEPISTLLGIPATIGGIGLVASGIIGRRGVGREIKREVLG